jgi:hypothetical protein
LAKVKSLLPLAGGLRFVEQFLRTTPMKHLALIAIVAFGLFQQPTKAPEGKGVVKSGSAQGADQANAGKDNKPTVQTPPVPDNNANKSTTDEGERFANHRLVTGGRNAEGCDSSQVTDLPLVGQPIG